MVLTRDPAGRFEGRRARRAGLDGVGVASLNQDPICTAGISGGVRCIPPMYRTRNLRADRRGKRWWMFSWHPP